MSFLAQDFDDSSLSSDFLSLSLKKENISSYGGIYSNLNEEQSISDWSTENKNSKTIKKTNTQEVTFQWDEEESESEVVYLTGSFCNWKQFFIMQKKDHKYSVTLDLPKTLHKFKFRINEDYKLNEKYPIMKDGEIKCNFIDISNTKDTNNTTLNSNKSNTEDNDNDNNDENNSESNSNSDSSSLYDSSNDDNYEGRIRKKRIKMKKKRYSQIYPKANDLNNYAPDIPYCYDNSYNININSHQNRIGLQKYFHPKEKDILGSNCSYKKIGLLPAVEINHIHSNNLICTENRALCSSFMRYRNKFVTFLYYKSI